MMSAIRFSAAFKSSSPAKADEKYQKELGRKDRGPVCRDAVKAQGDQPETFLVCTREDAVKLSRARSAYQLQYMKVALHNSRGRLPDEELVKEREYRASYRAVQQELLEQAQALD